MEKYPEAVLFLLFWVSLRGLFYSRGSRFLWLVWERSRNHRKETKREKREK